MCPDRHQTAQDVRPSLPALREPTVQLSVSRFRRGTPDDWLRSSEARESPAPGGSTNWHSANIWKGSSSEQTERARFIASLTDDELRQLRGRLKDPDLRAAGDKQFAHNFFSGSDDGDDQDDGDDAGEYTDEQRQWARELFATLGAENDVLPGLSSGGPSAARHQRGGIPRRAATSISADRHHPQPKGHPTCSTSRLTPAL